MGLFSVQLEIVWATNSVGKKAITWVCPDFRVEEVILETCFPF